MIKQYPISDKVLNDLYSDFPYIEGKINVEKVLNSLLKNLPEKEKPSREYVAKCMKIVASAAVYYFSELNKLLAEG